jgi:hypothetical protein
VRGHQLHIPPYLIQEDPMKTTLVLGALAACAVAFIQDTLAPQFEVEISDISATAGCTADLAGLLGLPGTDPRLHDLDIAISITSPSPADRLAAMQQAWLHRCPVLLALRDANQVRARFD